MRNEARVTPDFLSFSDIVKQNDVINSTVSEAQHVKTGFENVSNNLDFLEVSRVMHSKGYQINVITYYITNQANNLSF